jgi:hypothetical protein
MSKHEDQAQQIQELRERVGVGKPLSIAGVVVAPLASDEVQAAAERFRELRHEAKSAVTAAAIAHAEQGESREARVKARAAAALEGKSPTAAKLKTPDADVDELIEHAEGLVEATKAQRGAVIKAMDADLPEWRVRNAAQVEEAKASLSQHIDAAQEAFEKLDASAHLRVFLEGRTLTNSGRADLANAYSRRKQRVEFFANSGTSDPDAMFDALRQHFAADGLAHQPVEAGSK